MNSINGIYCLILGKISIMKIKYLIIPIFLLILASCKTETPKEITIKEDVVFLADDALEGRQTGSDGELKAAKYISERYESIGLSPKGTFFIICWLD